MKTRDLREALRNLPLAEPCDQLDRRISRLIQNAGLEHLSSPARPIKVTSLSAAGLAGAAATIIVCVLLLSGPRQKEVDVRHFIVLNDQQSRIFTQGDDNRTIFQRESTGVASLLRDRNRETSPSTKGRFQ
ncbi:MAG TPA: hypothetical protein PLV45_05470 [bacterium]|nr:hypothetical protein [bacterium]